MATQQTRKNMAAMAQTQMAQYHGYIYQFLFDALFPPHSCIIPANNLLLAEDAAQAYANWQAIYRDAQ